MNIREKTARGDMMVFTDTHALTGVVTCEVWVKGDAQDDTTLNQLMDEGRLHRADGPAIIWRAAATGNILCEAWFRDGKADRQDGPAFIEHDGAGGVIQEEWWKDGRPIPNPLPARA
jgi:hypothetical protein